MTRKFGPGGKFGKTGFLYRHYTGKYRPRRLCNPGKVHCPDRKEQVAFRECLECPKFRVWHEKDRDLKRCWYQYRELRSRGFYDGTWDDHPENFDPRTFARIQEEKRRNEELNREMDREREALRAKAEELAEEREEEEEREDAEEPAEPEEEEAVDEYEDQEEEDDENEEDGEEGLW